MKMKKLIIFTSLVIGIILPASGQQNDGDEIVIGKYRTIDSKVLSEQRRILVNLPVGYETSDVKYPVVFHLYGDYVMT